MKPEIRNYLDFREFLKDWIRYLKNKDRKYSLRFIAKKAGLSNAVLTRVLKYNARIKKRSFEKLTMVLGLNRSQQSYIDHLYIISESSDPQERVNSIKALKRFKNFQQVKNKEIEKSSFLEGWENIVIREMASLKSFRADPEWIEKKFRGNISKAKIQKSLQFLLKNNYLKENSDGVIQGEETLRFDDNSIRLSLKEFYKQMFALVSEIYAEGRPAHRATEAYTFAIKKESFPELENILIECMDRIEKLEARPGEGELLYFTSVFAEPLNKI